MKPAHSPVGLNLLLLVLSLSCQCVVRGSLTGEAIPVSSEQVRLVPGLWHLGPCANSAGCQDNEDCVHLEPVQRAHPAASSTSTRQRPAIEYCVRIEKNTSSSESIAMCEEQMHCEDGQVPQCRQPSLPNRRCTRNQTCILSAVIGRCVWLKGATVETSITPATPVHTDQDSLQENCQCDNNPPLNALKTCLGLFDYVLKIRVLERTQDGYSVLAKKVDYFRWGNLTTVSRGTHGHQITLYMNRVNVGIHLSCECPDLRPHSLYFIAGRTDPENHTRLLIDEHTVVASYSGYYTRLFVNLLQHVCPLRGRRNSQSVSQDTPRPQFYRSARTVLVAHSRQRGHHTHSTDVRQRWIGLHEENFPHDFWTASLPTLPSDRHSEGNQHIL